MGFWGCILWLFWGLLLRGLFFGLACGKRMGWDGMGIGIGESGVGFYNC